MDYQFITTIISILLMGLTTIGVVLRIMNVRFAVVESRFDGVKGQFEGVNRPFEGVDQRLDHVDERFDKVDDRFDKVGERCFALQKQVHQGFLGVEKQFTELHSRTARPEGLVEGVQGSIALLSASPTGGPQPEAPRQLAGSA